MSGMGQTIYDRGMEKGIEQGVMQGIIKMGYDLELPESEIIKQLQTQLGTSLQKAQEYLNKFGKKTESVTRQSAPPNIAKTEN